MKMVIDGIIYDIKDNIAFRFPKWKIIVLITALTLMAITLVHADPTIWTQWSAGGGMGRMGFWRT